MKNSKLLSLLFKNVKFWVKHYRYNDVVLKPIGNKYLPKDTYIRLWYNQAYFCMHSGMNDACIAMVFVLLENISRKVYANVIPKPKPREKIKWNDVIIELERYFNKPKTAKEYDAIRLIQYIKTNARRNKILHGDPASILSKYKYKAIKLNLKYGTMKLADLKASSPIVPEVLKVAAYQRCVAESAIRAMSYLPYIIKPLSKY